MAKRAKVIQPQPIPHGAQLVFEPFDKQMKFIEAALCGKFKFLLFGGSIRCGKSFVALALVIILCKIYPGSRWVIIRNNLPVIRRNVVPVFEKLRPRQFIREINKTTWTATCANGSQILFVPESIKDDPDGNKWRGFEVNGAVLEEANELSVQTFNAMIERVGTWTIPGNAKQPAPLVLLTCNPSQSWVKTAFYDPWVAKKLKAPYYFMQARADDNPHIGAELKEQWKSLPPHVYKKFVLGDWSVSDDPMQVIPYEALHSRLLMEPPDRISLAGEEALGVDYGGAGGRATSNALDLSAFSHFRGETLYECEMLDGLSQGQIATLIQTRMSERGIDAGRVGVDVIGEGSGVWGNLHDAGINVRAVLAGGAPWDIAMTQAERSMGLQYRNLKAQMWWMMRRSVTEAESELRIINDARLVQDLLSVRYKISSEKRIEMESKEDVRRRIGRSPDAGESAVIGNLVRLAGGSEWGAFEGGAEAGGTEEFAEALIEAESIQNEIESLWDGGISGHYR